MRRVLGLWCLGVLWLLLLPLPATAGTRVALVVGNNAYQYGGVLANAIGDAEKIGNVLEQLGFQVIRKQNLTYAGLLGALDELGKAATGADWVVVYYAGHAVQIAGKNHLVPVDVGLNREGDLRRTTKLDDLLTEVNQARELGLVILDACRDNPFMARLNQGRSVAGRGLARVGDTGGGNTLVAFATAEDTIAADSGVYADVLAKHLKATPGLEVRQLFGKVRDTVMERTNSSQKPYVYGSLGGGSYAFKPPSRPPVPPADSSNSLELTFWSSIKDSRNAADFRAYLKRYPQGAFSDLAQIRLADLTEQARPATPVTPPAPPPPPPPPPRLAYEPAMVGISAGCFSMGSPANEPEREDDERQHEVCIQSDYEMGQYEVTQGEWEAVMGNNPSNYKQGDRYPVENVSWNDVQDYLSKLNQKTGKDYRLPTEAEWEYAARAGTESAYWWGERASHEYANYGKEECCKGLAEGRDRWEATAPVGSFAANAWGLYDTAGNVWEWTCSVYDEKYGGADQNPNAPDTGGPFSLRGGSWVDVPAGVRSANRFWNTPAHRLFTLGFRLARSL